MRFFTQIQKLLHPHGEVVTLCCHIDDAILCLGCRFIIEPKDGTCPRCGGGQLRSVGDVLNEQELAIIEANNRVKVLRERLARFVRENARRNPLAYVGSLTALE